MDDFPQTLLEFEQRFATEQACTEYLFKIRWPEGFRCGYCGHSQVWKMRRCVYRCVHCRNETSVRAHTIFQDTKKPLRLWFRAIWHLTSQKYGANALGLQRILGLGSYHTAWIWLHKLRRAMVRPKRDRLSGTVQVDETYMGGEKSGKRGRGAAGKALVIAMVEIKNGKIGRIRLSRISNASGQCLERAIEKSIEHGSVVQTDGWRGYVALPKLKYIHDIVREEASMGGNLLPKVNLVISLLKRWLLGTYQGRVEFSHLDYYLDEFTFRFNRRTSYYRGKLFYRLIQQTVTIEPLHCGEIYERKSRR